MDLTRFYNKFVMKILSKQKAWMLSFLLVLFFMKPINAQKSDSFFHDYTETNYRNINTGGYLIGTQNFGSDLGGYNISTQSFGNDLPLSGGLLIMVGAGSMYAALKRNKKLK